jgi:serine protease Do
VVTVRSEKVMAAPRTPFFEDPFEDFPWPFRFGPDGGDQRGQRNRPPQFRQRGLGSGIIIEPDGFILTNYHVVREANKLKVILSDDGRKEYDAKVIGSDPKTDLAVIKIEAKNLPYARLGDSDQLRVGEWVLAIGAPFGLSHTVTAGIISAKGRSGWRVSDYEDFIQTDAAINPGNSGGPLVNLRGEVVGINTAIASNTGGYEGIGFSIPSNMAKQLLPTLKTGGKVVRGYLGVVIQNVTGELAERFGLKSTAGVLISEIKPDSAAARAGLEVGDVVVELNGKPIEDVNQLRNAVAASKPGTKVSLTVLRDGKEKEMPVQLGELPSEQVAEAGPASENLGVTVQTLTPQIARQLGYKDEQGAVITAVESGSAADVVGLREGDLIVEVNRKPVASAEDFRQAVAASPKNLLLLVKSKEGARFVVMKSE